MKRIDFKVADMSCSACVMTLEGLEDDLPGVQRVNADYRRQQLRVEYDETRVTPDEIIAAVRDLGYRALPWP